MSGQGLASRRKKRRFRRVSVSRGREVFREGGELVGEESEGCFCPPISPIIIMLIVQWL